MVANVIGMKKPPWMEMDQWWRPLAQDRSPLDREVQHESSDRDQRTSALLGRSCCQNGLLRDLCAGFEVSGTSVVEVATTPLERKSGPHPNDSTFSDGRTWCRRRFPSLLEIQMAVRKQSIRPQDGCNSLRILGDGDSLQHLG